MEINDKLIHDITNKNMTLYMSVLIFHDFSLFWFTEQNYLNERIVF